MALSLVHVLRELQLKHRASTAQDTEPEAIGRSDMRFEAHSEVLLRSLSIILISYSDLAEYRCAYSAVAFGGAVRSVW